MKNRINILLCLFICIAAVTTTHVRADETSSLMTETTNEVIIRNDETGIPDKNLYVSVLDAGDRNKDGILTESEARQITNISVDYAAIINSTKTLSFKGISKLTQLTSIGSHNSYFEPKVVISEFDELISLKSIQILKFENIKNLDMTKINEFSQLVHLEISDSALMNIIPLNNLKSLNFLAINDSNFNDISTLTALPQLTSLSLVGNDITNIQVLDNLRQLSSLNLNSNQLTDISSLANLTQLTSLNLSGNKISNTNGVQSFVRLTNLVMSFNQLTDISSLANLTQLTSLNLSGNKISNTNGVQSLVRLTNLVMDSNQLTDISGLANLTQLTSLHLSGNKISNTNGVQNLVRLTDLSMRSNKLTDISNLNNLVQLTRLELSNNKLVNVDSLKEMIKLEALNISSNEIEVLPSLKALIKLDFNKIHTTGVAMDTNRLTKEELINKLPDQVKSNTKWIEANVSRPMTKFIEIKDGGQFSIKEIETVLNNKWVSDVMIKAENAKILPKEVLSLITKTNKSIRVITNGLEYWLAPDNIQNIHGDISLEVEEKSIYEKEIKELTKADDLFFVTFKANTTIGKSKIFYGDTKDPVTYRSSYNPYYADYMESEQWPEIYTYSYNSKNHSIKKLKTEHLLPITILFSLELEEDANTIFTSKKDGLETIKGEVEQPSTPEIIVRNKVINSQTIIDEEIIEALKNKDINNVIVNLKESDSISNELLESIKLSGKTITFNVINNYKVSYSWSFNGQQMGDVSGMAINLGVDFKTEKQKEIEKITNQKNMFYLQFAHHGTLPAPTTMQVDVSSSYKNGELIYLYYYNEETGVIEKASSGVKVIDGYATFNINHCSTYFFSKEELRTSIVETSDGTNIIGYSVLGLLVIVVMMSVRKKDLIK